MTRFKAFTLILGVLNTKLGEFRNDIKARDFQDEVETEEILDALADIQIYCVGRQVKRKDLVSAERIETIVFNYERELHKQKYVYKTEVISVFEEAIEVLGFKSEVARKLAEKYVNNLPLEEVIKKGGRKETIQILNKAKRAVEKLGYDNELVLQEVEKQNKSRVGTIIDGKFVKDTSPEAIAKYYVPDFSKAKLTGDRNE